MRASRRGEDAAERPSGLQKPARVLISRQVTREEARRDAFGTSKTHVQQTLRLCQGPEVIE